MSGLPPPVIPQQSDDGRAGERLRQAEVEAKLLARLLVRVGEPDGGERLDALLLGERAERLMNHA